MSEGHAAAHTLLNTSVSKVTVPLATGLRNQLVVVAEPEETLLKVLGAVNAAAVKLHRGTQKVWIRAAAVTQVITQKISASPCS